MIGDYWDKKDNFKFYNIGKGLFYSTKIDGNLIIYDCGGLIDNIRKGLDELSENNSFNKTIKALIISHFHLDHIKGIPDLKKRFKKIEKLYVQNILIKNIGATYAKNHLLQKVVYQDIIKIFIKMLKMLKILKI